MPRLRDDNRLRSSGLQLQLLRHAKSDWQDPALADIDRPLARRGQKAASAMGRFIGGEGLSPDLVLCSPARRARETWGLVSREFAAIPEMRIVDALYDFGDGYALLGAIRAHGGLARRLMVVGHNPALEQLSRRLISEGPAELESRLRTKFPTCALAIIGFDPAPWEQLAENTGRLLRFIRPADIARTAPG